MSDKVNGPVEIPTGADLNNYTIPGMYFCPQDATTATLKNCPCIKAFALFVEKGAMHKAIQTIKTYDNQYTGKSQSILYRQQYYWENGSTKEWNKWVSLAIAEPPQIYELPLLAPFVYDGDFRPLFWKTQEGVITITGKLRTSKPPISGSIITTLPQGFRPNRRVVGAVTFRNADASYIEGSGHIIINMDGTIGIHSSEMVGSYQHSIAYNISFIAAQ